MDRQAAVKMMKDGHVGKKKKKKRKGGGGGGHTGDEEDDEKGAGAGQQPSGQCQINITGEALQKLWGLAHMRKTTMEEAAHQAIVEAAAKAFSDRTVVCKARFPGGSKPPTPPPPPRPSVEDKGGGSGGGSADCSTEDDHGWSSKRKWSYGSDGYGKDKDKDKDNDGHGKDWHDWKRKKQQ